MKNKVIRSVMMLSCLASISHMQAMENNCMSSNDTIMQLHASLIKTMKDIKSTAYGTGNYNQADERRQLGAYKYELNNFTDYSMVYSEGTYQEQFTFLTQNPLLSLYNLKTIIHAFNSFLYNVQKESGKPAGVNPVYQTDFNDVANCLPKLQALLNLIKNSCTITDEDIENFKETAIKAKYKFTKGL
jgi:hypothetical protein